MVLGAVRFFFFFDQRQDPLEREDNDDVDSFMTLTLNCLRIRRLFTGIKIWCSYYWNMSLQLLEMEPM